MKSLAEHSYEPDAVCSIAAPVFLNNIREGVVKSYLYYIARTVAIFVSTIKTEIHAVEEKRMMVMSYGLAYNGTFVRVGVSFLYALKLIRRDLSKITLPIIVIHDKEDRTVSYKNLSYIIRHISSTHVKEVTTEMEAPHNHHVLLMHTSIQESLLKTILTFFEQHTYKEPL